ncbi:MAG: carboxy terminal-processing peptidase [Planctomycetota bacterium]
MLRSIPQRIFRTASPTSAPAAVCAPAKRWGTPAAWSLIAVLCFSTLAMPAAQAQDGLEPQRPRDTLVAKVIAALMPRNHVSTQSLDDEISGRALDLFVESLDPLKLYFEKSDIQEFEAFRSKIDDMVKEGDLRFAYQVFTRFVQRIDQRLPMINQLLDQPFDFSADEYLVSDPDLLNYPTSAQEIQDRWRRKLKYDLLSLKDEHVSDDDNKDKPFDREAATEKLRRRYARYARRWKKDTKNDQLLEYFLTSVTNGYDPHSTYMSPTSFDDFNIAMKLNLDGIGAQLQEKDGLTTITRVIPGGAADKHGILKPDDVIVSVGQDDNGPMVEIVEMPLGEVVKMIRGPKNTRVRLGVKKGGTGTVKEITITRDRIQLDEQAARGEIIEHAVDDSGSKLKLGYIMLPSFYMDMESARRDSVDFRSSTRDVRRILDDFRSKGVDGVVLDLSRNGGGSLTEAIDLTGLFIDRGTVVQVKNSDGTVNQYRDEERGTVYDGPLVVMTSKMSASASEILAGAIRDYGRGIVVGDPQTHGKGSVQTLIDIGERIYLSRRKNLGALKVTLQQFYLPDGRSTQLQGVPSDVVLPSLTAKMDIGEGDLEHALEFDTVPASEHTQYSMAPEAVIQRLRTRSMDRVGRDEEFKDLSRRVALYVQQKEEKRIPLNEEKFFARRAELDARKEEEEKILEQQMGTEEVYTDYFYNKEVMNIAYDYIRLLRERNLARAGN